MVAPMRGYATDRPRVLAGLRGVATRRRLARRIRYVLTSPNGRAQLVAAIVVIVVALLLLNSCSGTPVTPALSSGLATVPVAPSSPTAAGSIAATPQPTPTSSPSPTPVPLVEAPTNGVLETAAEASRPVVAVMIDDAPAARPQSGLAEADVFFQAPAEGGIPRYMALYQSQTAPAIGPVRSSRRYFVGWAAEWRPLYVHVGGAPNALEALHQENGHLLWDGDQFAYPQYMPRITARVAPHNVYSSTAELDALAQRLGVPPAPAAAWTFADPVPAAERPASGSIVVPYPAGVMSYTYDPSTDRYLRSVDGAAQVDAGTGQRVAPYDVVVLYVSIGPLLNEPGQTTNQAKGRLEVGYTGSGPALVMRDGLEIPATWSKASDAAPLLLTYRGGPNAGAPIPLVRGQVAVQVVPIGTAVTVRTAPVPSVSSAPASPAPSDW